MNQFISLLFLAFAVSLDSFGVGVTYGMRKITVPIRSILIIACCSGLVMLIAMSIGHGLSLLFTPEKAQITGGFILIGIGLWALINVYRHKPLMADFDQSGSISPIEAVVLGMALALDAFGAGIGAALIGFSPWITASFIAMMSGLLVNLGIRFGSLFAEAKWLGKTILLPGLILITLGIMKLL